MAFQMEINPDFEEVVVWEGPNSAIKIREMKWGSQKDFHTDIRRWTYGENGEQALKGISLPDGADNTLTEELVRIGRGDTKTILRNLSTRDDFIEALNSYDKVEDKVVEDESQYYDPSILLVS